MISHTPALAGVVVASTCDQMRRMAQVPGETAGARGSSRFASGAAGGAAANAPVAPAPLLAGCCHALDHDLPSVFVMHVPATWQDPAAHRYFQAELRRMGRWMERLGCGRAQQPQPKFVGDGRAKQPQTPSPGTALPIAVLGPHLLRCQERIFSIVSANGGVVVLDGTGNGERGWPAPVDRRGAANLVESLADRYFGAIPDAFRRPNTLLYAWLKREAEKREVRGLIFLWQTWCDIWHAEAWRMREWWPGPMLSLELQGGDGIDAATCGRIEAFMEAVRNGDAEGRFRRKRGVR